MKDNLFVIVLLCFLEGAIATECVDKLHTCTDYDSKTCLSYRPWAEDHCKQFCGFCDPFTSPTGFYGKCVHQGSSYATGQTWNIDCDYECTCINQTTGEFRCYNKCPLYLSIEPQCTLVKDNYQCCKVPTMQGQAGKRCPDSPITFNNVRSFVKGVGTISWNGVDRFPTPPPVCQDKKSNCHLYGKAACANPRYKAWALDNCRKFCNLCDTTSTTKATDHCLHQGNVYKEGEKWQPSWDIVCTCENAAYGYYTCINLCPMYTNLPSNCYILTNANQRCSSLKCRWHGHSYTVLSTNYFDSLNMTSSPVQSTPIPSSTIYGTPSNTIQTTAIMASTSSSTTCQDSMPSCEHHMQVYGMEVCTRTLFHEWALANCQRYCGLCPSTTAKTLTTSSSTSSLFCETCEDYYTSKCVGASTECNGMCMLQNQGQQLHMECRKEFECQLAQVSDGLHNTSTVCCSNSTCVLQSLKKFIDGKVQNLFG